MLRLLAGHALAVVASGLFAAAFILALRGVLLFIFGERWFRKISLLVQGAILAVLLLTLLLFPVYSGATAAVLGSGGNAAWWFPPFWFVGTYQRLWRVRLLFQFMRSLCSLAASLRWAQSHWRFSCIPLRTAAVSINWWKAQTPAPDAT
jgi:hypothetical protein